MSNRNHCEFVIRLGPICTFKVKSAFSGIDIESTLAGYSGTIHVKRSFVLEKHSETHCEIVANYMYYTGLHYIQIISNFISNTQ